LFRTIQSRNIPPTGTYDQSDPLSRDGPIGLTASGRAPLPSAYGKRPADRAHRRTFTAVASFTPPASAIIASVTVEPDGYRDATAARTSSARGGLGTDPGGPAAGSSSIERNGHYQMPGASDGIESNAGHGADRRGDAPGRMPQNVVLYLRRCVNLDLSGPCPGQVRAMTTMP
jgi:hypothetical protein